MPEDAKDPVSKKSAQPSEYTIVQPSVTHPDPNIPPAFNPRPEAPMLSQPLDPAFEASGQTCSHSNDHMDHANQYGEPVRRRRRRLVWEMLTQGFSIDNVFFSLRMKLSLLIPVIIELYTSIFLIIYVASIVQESRDHTGNSEMSDSAKDWCHTVLYISIIESVWCGIDIAVCPIIFDQACYFYFAVIQASRVSFSGLVLFFLMDSCPGLVPSQDSMVHSADVMRRIELVMRMRYFLFFGSAFMLLWIPLLWIIAMLKHLVIRLG